MTHPLVVNAVVSNKVLPETRDGVCLTCSQCWEAQCRAYCLPHSEEERAHRLKDGRRHVLRCLSLDAAIERGGQQALSCMDKSGARRDADNANPST